MSRNIGGFSLIELMIVMAIIGILAMIGYPLYLEQVKQSRRVDAQGTLMSLANAMERYFVENNTYVTATIGSGAGAIFPDEAPLDGATKFYDLVIPAATLTATSYVLHAEPKNGQDGDGCLALGSDGIKIRYAADDCSGATSPW